MNNSTQVKSKKEQFRSLIFGGLLPVVIFTVIEEYYGVMYGLIAAIVFGLGEIIFEKIKFQKVSKMTLVGNGLIIGLGVISLLFQDGIWFKLQPAIFEFGFFVFLVGSFLIKKPFLKIMLQQQNPEAPEFIKNFMSGLTFRLGLFFLIQSILATWAAYSWSTANWALLKSIGLLVMILIYMVLEFVFLKFRTNYRS